MESHLDVASPSIGRRLCCCAAGMSIGALLVVASALALRAYPDVQPPALMASVPRLPLAAPPPASSLPSPASLSATLPSPSIYHAPPPQPRPSPPRPLARPPAAPLPTPPLPMTPPRPTPPPLIEKCTASLVSYHQWLTDWFTGTLPETALDRVLAGLDLAPTATLTDPQGGVHDRDSLTQLLRATRASEPAGSTHRPDLGSIAINSQRASLIDLTFHEIQTQIRPGGWARCTLTTRGVCEEALGAPSGIRWRGFVERSEAPCEEGTGDPS